MDQVTELYAKVLTGLDISSEDIEKADEIIALSCELSDALQSPVVLPSEKDRIIERLFPSSLHSFFKVLCRNGESHNAREIFSSYRTQMRSAKRCILAVLEYVTPLTEEQKVRMTELVKRRTGCENVELKLVCNPDIMGGFILTAGDYKYDRSTRKTMTELKRNLIRPGVSEHTSRNKTTSHTMRATLEYVTPPTEEQKVRIIEFIRKKTGYKEVELNLKENKELIGGFILHAGNLRYDRSAVREVSQMRRELMRR